MQQNLRIFLCIIVNNKMILIYLNINYYETNIEFKNYSILALKLFSISESINY